MLKKVTFGAVTLVLLVAMIFMVGCETKAQTGALVGAGGGALAGQAISRDTTGTLIGAGVGAVGGGLIGHSMDKSDENKQKETAPAPPVASDQNTVTVLVTNSNGSQTPVRLTRNPDGSYTGPKGEVYKNLPTAEQLKPIYGI